MGELDNATYDELDADFDLSVEEAIAHARWVRHVLEEAGIPLSDWTSPLLEGNGQTRDN